MKISSLRPVPCIVFFFIMLFSSLIVLAGDGMMPVNLRCEYRTNPTGIDSIRPRFSWDYGVPNGKISGESQTAWRIVVFESDRSSGQKTEVWDSGWNASNQMSQIEYDGKPLQSDQTYFWSLQVKDEKEKVHAATENGTWTTGFFDQQEWTAQWIGSDEIYDENAGKNGADCNFSDPWLRKSFDLSTLPTRATLFVASIGYHEVYVNGKKIGNHVLAPNVTNYTKRARYIAYDIAPALVSGKNVIALWLGTGWSIFGPYISPGLARTPQVIAQTDIFFENGNPKRIVTDDSWKVHPSSNRLLGNWGFGNYGGERQDANREKPGWNLADFDDSTWKKATVYYPAPLAGPRIGPKNDPLVPVEQEQYFKKGKPLPLSAQMSEPNELQKEIRPVAVQKVRESVWRVDMGVNFAGWMEIKVKGAPGDTIEFRLSEAEKQEMTFRNRSQYVIGPSGEGTFRNRFNYGSGRWLTIIGMKEEPSLDSIRGWSVRTGYEPMSKFESSDELLNWVYRTVLWTYENLTLGGYVVDCPQRERFGYGGDAHATVETGIYNYQLAAFYAKWLEDWRDCQGREPCNCNLNNPDIRANLKDSRYYNSGILPNTAPTYYGGGGPAWGGACVILPELLWRQYGDCRVLSENFKMISDWLDFLEVHTKADLLQPYGDQWSFLADWLWPGDPAGMPDKVFFNSCYRVFNLKTAAEIADRIGNTKKAAKWRARAESGRKAIHAKYYKPDEHSYLDGTQPILALALLAEVPPADCRAAVIKRLEQEILVTKKGHIGAGITGGSLLFRLLRQECRNDLILTMVTKKDYPGWGFMRANDATTIWEAWEKDRPGHSLLHSSYLSPSAWCIDSLLGIRPNRKTGGFQACEIVLPDVQTLPLDRASGYYSSLNGRIESRWEKKNGSVVYTIGIPANCTATVYLPNDQNPRQVTSGVHQFTVK